jgi:hypothetical protein
MLAEIVSITLTVMVIGFASVFYWLGYKKGYAQGRLDELRTPGVWK